MQGKGEPASTELGLTGGLRVVAAMEAAPKAEPKAARWKQPRTSLSFKLVHKKMLHASAWIGRWPETLRGQIMVRARPPGVFDLDFRFIRRVCLEKKGWEGNYRSNIWWVRRSELRGRRAALKLTSHSLKMHTATCPGTANAKRLGKWLVITASI